MNEKRGPYFSIITVCLNSASTIASSLQSVLRQECNDYEYIVVDGGSDDGTIDVIKEFSEKFNGRLTLISERDEGLYFAMNKGIKLARGSFVGILNSDDRYLGNALSHVKATSMRCKADMIYGNINLYNDENPLDTPIALRADHTSLPQKMLVFHPASFVKRSIYEKYGLYETSLRLSADFEFFCRISQAPLVYAHLDEPLVIFRRGGLTARHPIRGLFEDWRVRRRYCPASFANAQLVKAGGMLSYGCCRDKVAYTVLGHQLLEYLRSIRHRKDRLSPPRSRKVRS